MIYQPVLIALSVIYHAGGFLLSPVVRNAAKKNSLLDCPNSRRCHNFPATPNDFSNSAQTAAKDWHIARGSSWRLHARKTVGDIASTNKIAENKMKPKAKAKAKAKARPVVGSHSALPEVDAPKFRPKAKSKPKAKVVRESNIEEKVAMKGKRANKSGGDAVLGAASSSGGSQGEERSLLGMLPDEMDPLTLVAALKKQYQPPSSSAVAVEHSESKGTADTGHAMGSSMGRNSPSKKKKKQANKLAAEDITDIFGKTEQLGELGGELSDLLDIQHPDDISEEELERVLRELDARMSAGEELGNGWDELDSRSLSLSPEDEAAAAKIIAELGLGNWNMPGIDGYGEEDGVEEEQQAQSKTPRRQQGAAVRGLGDSGSENSENTDGNKEVASSISMPRTAAASRSNAPADSSGDADASDDDKSGDVVIAGVKMRGKDVGLGVVPPPVEEFKRLMEALGPGSMFEDDEDTLFGDEDDLSSAIGGAGTDAGRESASSAGAKKKGAKKKKKGTKKSGDDDEEEGEEDDDDLGVDDDDDDDEFQDGLDSIDWETRPFNWSDVISWDESKYEGGKPYPYEERIDINNGSALSRQAFRPGMKPFPAQSNPDARKSDDFDLDGGGTTDIVFPPDRTVQGAHITVYAFNYTWFNTVENTTVAINSRSADMGEQILQHLLREVNDSRVEGVVVVSPVEYRGPTRPPDKLEDLIRSLRREAFGTVEAYENTINDLEHHRAFEDNLQIVAEGINSYHLVDGLAMREAWGELVPEILLSEKNLAAMLDVVRFCQWEIYGLHDPEDTAFTESLGVFLTPRQRRIRFRGGAQEMNNGFNLDNLEEELCTVTTR